MDQWRYFKEGVEVYRDIDTNGNNKPDEYRWFNMAGSRWGLDKNEDQRIESWKRISAEEVTAEAFTALKTGDKPRFMALLLTPEEIDALDITAAQKKQLKGLIEKAVTDFEEGVKAKAVDRKAEFLQFNGDKPSAIPSEIGDGIVAFENVSSFARINDTEMQLANGTLIQIGDAWKALFCPLVQTDAEHGITSIFLPGGAAAAAVASSNAASAQKQQELIGSIERIDTQLQQATDRAQKNALHKQRASVVEKIAQSSVGEERDMWYRQLADGLQMGAQLGELADGADILSKFAEKFKAEGDDNLAGYFSFRELMTRYYLGMASPNADWAEIQMKWYEGLEKFVQDYPNSLDSAEAMFQLANAREMSGRESEAVKWYSQIVSKFPQSPQAIKSKGALYRLGCVGKQMQLKGITSNNKALDIAKFKDYNVIVYYWSAISSSAQSDVLALKAAKEKYGSKLQIIGINLDNNPEQMNQFVEQNKISWYQIDGKGMDGALACELGIIAPTMIIVDASGKIVNRSVQPHELDSALKMLFSPPAKLD
ncbi:MAG: hypothetical protein IKS45_02665, partial [Thermoguttaceae bacterium]|nr:hypothetical protein [Thermoguttaceae bacterium]